MPKADPVDPARAGRVVVRGRIVTMNAASEVLSDGCVYIDAGLIIAVQAAAAPAPPGFNASTPSLRTQGSVYPGLIDLHNHLAYNALRLWPITRAYANRDQW